MRLLLSRYRKEILCPVRLLKSIARTKELDFYGYALQPIEACSGPVTTAANNDNAVPET